MCAVGSDRRGFTLLELLVVLVIASLAISLVGPAFQRLLPGLQLEAQARTLVAMLRHARSQAILSGDPVAISQDADGGLRLSYRPQAYRLPAPLSLTLTAGPGQSDTAAGTAQMAGTPQMVGTPQILFYPRGDSSGGSLEIKQAAGRSELLSVDWLSGRVRRGAEAPPSRRPKSLDQDDKGRDRDANDEREVGGALNE